MNADLIHRKKSLHLQIIITIILSFLELILIILLKSMYSSSIENFYARLGLAPQEISVIISWLTPTGLLFLINFYYLTPLIIKLACYYEESTNFIDIHYKRFDRLKVDCLKFIVGCNVYWGTRHNDKEVQNANICEGLMALLKTGKENKYHTVYSLALNNLQSAVTEDGLKSKSLSLETTVCTSMFIYVCSLIKNKNRKTNRIIKQCVKKLWESRTETGWGIFLRVHNKDNTRLSHSFWALRAIISFGEPELFKGLDEYVCSFYERSDSLFGYSFDDHYRISITAMFTILYYELPSGIRTKVSKHFNPQKAIKFLLDEALKKKLYVEIEEINGLDEFGSIGIKKVPWNHVSIGYALEAFGLASLNKDIEKKTIFTIAKELNAIAHSNIKYMPTQHAAYFNPITVDSGSRGILTFPTVYFVIGLHIFNEYCLKGRVPVETHL